MADKLPYQDDLPREPESGEAFYQTGMRKHEGMGVPMDWLEAFLNFHAAARLGHWRAQAMLARYYAEGIVGDPDPREAYVWALLARSGDLRLVDKEYLETIASPLSKKEKLAAQKEANRRFNEFKDKGIIILPELTIESILTDSATPEPNNGSGLGWGDVDISQLRVTLFMDSGKIRLEHGGHCHLALASKLFSPNCLSLLIAYDKLKEHGEGEIRYHECTLADARKGSTRKNHQVVSDFNHSLRKLLGLPKSSKPFKWIGTRANRDLKANFHLLVRY